MITAIIQFFRWVGFRNFLTFALILVIFFLVRNRFFAKTDGEIQVTSLFKKIEYVQNLRLVSYYYEEIVAIGTSDRLQKLVNRAEDHVDDARREVIFAELLRDSLKVKMEKAIEEHESVDSTLIRIENDYLSLSDSLQKYNIKSFKKLTKLSPQRLSEYDANIKAKLQEHQVNEPLATDRRRERNAKNQRQKELEGEILTLLERKSTRFKRRLESKKKILQQMTKQSKVLRKDLKKAKKNAEKRFQDAAEKVMKLRGELEKSKENLMESQKELEKLKGDPLPKLLVVVSAEVTGMVDLKKMEIETVGLDSLTVVSMPHAVTDSVNIRMSDTKRFLANNKKDGIFSSGEEGLYYEVYQQLKDAMTETESRVLQKALDAGILAETNEMAHEYIRNVTRSMGFNAGFAEAPEHIQLEAEESINADSLKVLTDSLDLFLKQEKQRERSL